MKILFILLAYIKKKLYLCAAKGAKDVKLKKTIAFISNMNAQLANNQVTYDVINSTELSQYMTLEQMHERLTANIKNAFAK